MELFAKRVTGFQTWFWFDNSSKPLYPANGNTCKTGITWILIKCYDNLRQKTSNFMKLYIYQMRRTYNNKKCESYCNACQTVISNCYIIFRPLRSFQRGSFYSFSLLKKFPYSEFFRPVFSDIRTEYGNLLRKSRILRIFFQYFLYVTWYNKISLSQQYNTQIMPKVFTTPCWNSWTSPRSVFRTLANV